MNIPSTKQGVSEDGHGPVKNRKASLKAGLSVLVDYTGKISNLLEDFRKVERFAQSVWPARYADGYSDIYSDMKSSKKTGNSSKKT